MKEGACEIFIYSANIFRPGDPFFSWSLGSDKIGKTVPVTAPANGDIVARSAPPSSSEEFFLMGCGLTVLVGGLLQWKARIGGSVIQTAAGAVLVIMYLY
jgi:hypothetical protein